MIKQQGQAFSKIEVYESYESFEECAAKGLHIIMSLNKKTSFEYDRKCYNLGYGDFFILNKPHRLCKVIEKSGKLLYLVLRLDGYNQKLIYQRQCLAGNSAISTQSCDIEMKDLLVNLLEIFLDSEHPDLNALNASYYRILNIVFNNYFQEKYASVQNKNLEEEELFFQIIDYIDQNYHLHLTLNEISRQFYLSSSTLSKFFQKKAGKKFLSYLTDKRLEAAESKILTTEDSIIQIALETGFPNVASFNKAFKAKHNETPAKYRKQINKKEVAEEIHSINNDELEKLIENRRKKQLFQQTESIDIEKEITPNIISWKHLVNLGSVQSILQYGFNEQLEDMQKCINFTHGRFWGLFDEMSFSNDLRQNCQYNFTKAEKVIDLMISKNLIPFIELGDKPFIINRNANRRVFSEGQRLPFFELKNWENILEEFIRFSINKWGREAVSTWHFEFWKTNLTVTLDKADFMEKGNLYHEESELYIQRFNKISKLIKKYVPRCKVGGCGLSIDLEEKYMNRFIKRWTQEEIKPDFFSIYLYMMNPEKMNQDSLVENRISNEKDYFSKKLCEVKRVLSEHSFEDLPLLVTEWNLSISNRNYLQDTCFKAAFVIKSILEAAPYVDCFGYWLLSDLYGEFVDTDSLIHGGAGLITKNNIKKPAFYSYDFISQLGPKILFLKQDLVITKDFEDNLFILMVNYKQLNQIYFLQDESEALATSYANIFEDTLAKEVTIHFKKALASKYRITSQVVNDSHGSILNNISSVGDSRILRQREVDYLKEITQPQLEVEIKELSADSLTVKSTLMANEIRLVIIEKLV